jgi:hypothetical protein
MSVTKEFAVKIDTELAELHGKIWEINSKILTYRDYQKSTEQSRFGSDADKASSIAKYAEKIDELLIERAPLKDRVRELDKIYVLDPWTRAFLVINSNGHVHSSMNCNTCFDTTRYNWLIQYSNDDENTIVEDAGQDACTICYPSAPAEVLNRPSRIVTADKTAKAQAKAEREAKKAEKIAKEKANAPTKSGEFLYFKDGKYTEIIKTERSAVTEWFNLQWKVEVVTHYFDGTPHSPESILEQEQKIAQAKEKADIICGSLAEKNGVSFDQQLKILENKYQKRRAS